MALGRPSDDVLQCAAHHPRLRRRPVRPAPTLSPTETTTLLGVALLQVWWAISFMAGARGNGSGIALPVVAIWSVWRARARPGWFMPAVAAALVVGTVVSLANTPIPPALSPSVDAAMLGQTGGRPVLLAWALAFASVGTRVTLRRDITWRTAATATTA